MTGALPETPDTQAVYRALRRESPQEANHLAETSGISGEHLDLAVRRLEEQGLIESGRATGGAYSFSAVRLAK